MDKRAKKAWMINLALVLAAVVIVALKDNGPRSTVHAAGTGWETDNIIANALDDNNERVVVINTHTKNIAVYKTYESGQLRLIGARDYRLDMLFHNTAGLEKVEKFGGASFMDVYDLYKQEHP